MDEDLGWILLYKRISSDLGGTVTVIRRRALLIKNAIVENGDEKTRGLYLVMQLPTPDLPTNDLLSRATAVNTVFSILG